MGQQVWATDSLGGYFSNDVLSQKIRHAAQPLMKFRQFVDAEAAIGRGRGEKVLFDKISNISSAGGTLVETDTIPKRNFTILQDSLTVTEYGNSIPFTLKVQTLSEVSVPDNIKMVLRNDMAKTLDSAAGAQFADAEYLAVCSDTATTVFTSDSTVTITATANMSDKNVRDIIDRLKTLNVPRYDGSNYICIGSTNSIRGLYDFFESKSYETTMDTVYNGEIGRYYGLKELVPTGIYSD